MKSILIVNLFMLWSLQVFSQSRYVNIPDANLLKELQKQGFDNDNDGIILKSDVVNVKKLRFVGRRIKDFTGLEEFKELETLEIHANFEEVKINEFIPRLTKLRSLKITSCLIKEFIYSKPEIPGYLPRLKHIEIYGSPILTKVDVSLLTSYYRSENTLEVLKITRCSELKVICLAARHPLYGLPKGFEKDDHVKWGDAILGCSNTVGIEEVLEEQGLIVIKAYNLQGREVPIDTKGEVIIVLYDNGRREKMYVQE